MKAAAVKKAVAAFTLLELITVVFIIAILAMLMLPGISAYRSRMDRVACTNNLKNLYVGANAYVQDKGHWPQINIRTAQSDRIGYAKNWIAALEPYGPTAESWICPTVQRSMDAPDIHDSKSIRVDYLATPFDTIQFTPYRWATQPWFVERGSVHGTGNLLIFSNGEVKSVNELAIK